MSGRAKWIVVGGVLAAAAAVAIALFYLRDGGEDVRTLVASGTVEATEARLGFQAAGRVEQIMVREGDLVTKGDTLGVLDRSEALARLRQAKAELTSASATLDELTSGSRPEEVATADASLEAAREQLEDARRDLERTRLLYDGGAVSREALDKAEMAYEVARARERQAEEQRELVVAGPRNERIQAQEGRIEGARAAVDGVEATLANMIAVAPFDGMVTVRHREPGETVPPGSAIVTLMNPSDRWVRIYVREDRIGAVKIGQTARVTSDTYPDRVYDGRIQFIASQAEFTPKNVQTTEERVKLVYAVKVGISGDPSLELKPGMPADVEIDLSEVGTTASIGQTPVLTPSDTT